MKPLLIAAFALLPLAVHAQTPAPNAAVTTQYGGEIVNIVDGDDNCTIIGPFRAVAGLPVSDTISIYCTGPGHTFNGNLSVIGFSSPVSGSFTASVHTLTWTFTKVTGGFDWDVSFDGIHTTGKF